MKELKFIHITKCAGTTIEDIGKAKNILWGRFHTEYGWWHQKFPNKKKELKDKYNWFMVVRNPYDRILSEYYCIWGGKKEERVLNANDFNSFLIQKIKNRCNVGHHYTEQYKYLDKNYDIRILKFENLEEEFNKLMSDFNLDIKLNRHENKGHYRQFTKKDFSKELINLINEIYKKDFEEFGYEMIN